MVDEEDDDEEDEEDEEEEEEEEEVLAVSDLYGVPSSKMCDKDRLSVTIGRWRCSTTS